MLKRFHQTYGGLYRLADALLISCAWLVAYWLRFSVPLIEVTRGFPPFGTYVELLPVILVVWLSTFSLQGAYQFQKIIRRSDEAFLLIRAHATSMMVLIFLTYLFSEYRYSRAVVGYFGTLGAFLIIFGRVFIRTLLRSEKARGFQSRKTLLIGDGETAERLMSRIRDFPELGIHCSGFLGNRTEPLLSVPRLGGYDEVSKFAHSRTFDRVVVALPREESARLDGILYLLKDEPLDIQVVPDILQYVRLGCEFENFEGLPILTLNDTPLKGWGSAAKRITDFTLSLIAIIVLSPLLLLIALLVKLTSRGPVFYAQERMGIDGKTFQMLKFRSMRTGAEDASGPVWAKPGDDRRTPIGAFLRSSSLDELPQFFNVLKGEMSLVGPRPERPVFVSRFRTEIQDYMLRHKVKAGITGWAQVNGWRGDTSLERRIECDLYYIQNWSYFLDLKILLLTIWKGFIHRNAY